MSYIESVEYTRVDGEKSSPVLRIYALSTCAFCEKAMSFLKDEGFSYEYLFMDLIDREVKKGLKTELKERHGSIPLFPLLVIDGEKAASGFTEEKWRELLEIG